jgi:hypothetical protein
MESPLHPYASICIAASLFEGLKILIFLLHCTSVQNNRWFFQYLQQSLEKGSCASKIGAGRDNWDTQVPNNCCTDAGVPVVGSSEFLFGQV